MKYEDAYAAIKQETTLTEYCKWLGINQSGFTRNNSPELTSHHQKLLSAFLAERHEAYQAMLRHKGNDAMDAQIKAVVELGKELDGSKSDE